MGLFIKNSSHKFIFPSPLLCKLPQAVILCPASLSQWQWLIEAESFIICSCYMLIMDHSLLWSGFHNVFIYLFIIFWKFKSTKKPLCEKLLGLAEKEELLDLQGLLKLLFQKLHIYLVHVFYSPSNSHDQAWHQQGREYNFPQRQHQGLFQ